jgi:SLT domain-containing protein
MALANAPANWLNDLETIALKESGGNPNAINLTDSNAVAGHPSQGLFQMIPTTFAAHMVAGHGNILSPIDSTASAVGYIRDRYGDVFHVPGILALSQGKSYIGYSKGGVIDEPISGVGLNTGTRYTFGENGQKEFVIPYVPSGVNVASSGGSAQSGWGGTNAATIVHVHNYIDGKEMTDVIGSHLVRSARTTGPIRSNS